MQKGTAKIAKALAQRPAAPGPVATAPAGPMDHALRERELAVKETEARLKEREFHRSRWTNPLVVAALAGVITGGVGIYSATTNAEQAREQEARRWVRGLADQRQKETSEAISEFSRHTAKGLQACSYVLFIAVSDPLRLDRGQIDRFDVTMREVMPAAMHALSLVGRHSTEGHRHLAQALGALSSVEGAVALNIRKYLRGTARGRAEFLRVHAELDGAMKGFDLVLSQAATVARAEIESEAARLLDPSKPRAIVSLKPTGPELPALRARPTE